MDRTSEGERWRHAWEVAIQHREFLRQLAERHRELVAQDGAEDAEDLLHAFLVLRLPRVVEVLDRLPEADRDRYLAVAFRNFARSHRRSTLRYQRALANLAAEPRAEPTSEPEGIMPGEREATAAGVDPLVREFFGTGADGLAS